MKPRLCPAARGADVDLPLKWAAEVWPAPGGEASVVTPPGRDLGAQTVSHFLGRVCGRQGCVPRGGQTGQRSPSLVRWPPAAQASWAGTGPCQSHTHQAQVGNTTHRADTPGRPGAPWAWVSTLSPSTWPGLEFEEEAWSLHRQVLRLLSICWGQATALSLRPSPHPPRRCRQPRARESSLWCPRAALSGKARGLVYVGSRCITHTTQLPRKFRTWRSKQTLVDAGGSEVGGGAEGGV